MTVPIKEAPIPSDGMAPRWLDNRHVLFQGLGPDINTRPLYVWDVEQGTVTKDPRFAKGYPEFINPETGSYVLGRTLFVDGKEFAVPKGVWINPVSGLPCKNNPPPWVLDGGTTPLRVALKEEHGYIHRGDSLIEDSPLLYYRTGVAEPVPLGLRHLHVAYGVTYLPFSGAYLLKGKPVSTKDVAMPMWLLFPDGKLQQVFDPTSKPWARTFGGQQLFTKRGVVSVQHNVRMTALGGQELRDSGLYALVDEQARLVVNAFLDYSSVSPDGCQLAVIKKRLEGDFQKIQAEEQFRIQVIDLCNGGQDVHH